MKDNKVKFLKQSKCNAWYTERGLGHMQGGVVFLEVCTECGEANSSLRPGPSICVMCGHNAWWDIWKAETRQLKE